MVDTDGDGIADVEESDAGVQVRGDNVVPVRGADGERRRKFQIEGTKLYPIT